MGIKERQLMISMTAVKKQLTYVEVINTGDDLIDDARKEIFSEPIQTTCQRPFWEMQDPDDSVTIELIQPNQKAHDEDSDSWKMTTNILE